MSNAHPSPRRRGGQSGNNNAFKHGLYAARPQPLDPDGGVEQEVQLLNDEIYSLRLLMRRVVELGDPQLTLPQAMEMLRTLSIASACVARLVRTRHFVRQNLSGQDEFSKMVDDVLHELENGENCPPASTSVAYPPR